MGARLHPRPAVRPRLRLPSRHRSRSRLIRTGRDRPVVACRRPRRRGRSLRRCPESARFVEGSDLVGPGLDQLTAWHPEVADGESTDDSAVIPLYGAVARKPQEDGRTPPRRHPKSRL
ncbi:SAM-dependent methyltransferase [Streptomyces sp. CHD11]|nr:SAM-dependent methyltransferase [Streptomyces sp. CHD11]